MDKDSFYDIDLGDTPVPAKAESGVIDPTLVQAITPPITITLGENKMAEIITGSVTGFVSNTQDQILAGVSDVRREGAEHTSEIQLENMKGFDRVNADVLRGTNETIKEGLKTGFDVRGDIKDSRYDVASRIGASAEAVKDQSTAYFIANSQYQNEAARDLAALKVLTDATAARMSSELALGIEKTAAATALESAKLGAAIALGQALLGKDLMLDGQKTRDLINDHKYHDMNRVLVERNSELVEERHERRHYRDRADQFQSQAQYASVQSAIQAFQSQLQTATQGTVNFGTMSGNAGRNASTNNVA